MPAKRDLLPGAALVALTLLAYGPVLRNGFVAFDDPDYVTQNEPVHAGLSWAGVRWAFTTFHAANWHPLAWLSHMLDWQLFGTWAGGHHGVSVLLHTANALLVWAVFTRLTGDRWRAWLVALCFAVHPTHVESVAWAAERKDVLSTLFGLLALLSYERYARRPRGAAYLLVAGCFALSLMAKPMWVTLPALLLVLDFWPLGRLRGLRGAGPLVAEKLPLLALSAAASWLTLLAQRQARVSIEWLPLATRLETATVAYAFYLRETLWPARLSYYYQYPLSWPAWVVAASVAVLLLLSGLALALRRERPALLAGWLWYLGTLVPVIGLVQVGMQYAADRYTYLPCLGVLVMAAWGVAWRPSWRWAALPAGLVLVALVVATRAQVRSWRSSEALFRHAIAVAPDNVNAHRGLGEELVEQGRSSEGLAHLRTALRLRPQYYAGHVALGRALARTGDVPGAVRQLAIALRQDPGRADARQALVHVLRQAGLPDPARARYVYQVAREVEQGRPRAAAVPFYLDALRLDPHLAEAHNDLGGLLADLGDLDGAVAHFRAALRERPDWSAARNNLSLALSQQRARAHVPASPPL